LYCQYFQQWWWRVVAKQNMKADEEIKMIKNKPKKLGIQHLLNRGKAGDSRNMEIWLVICQDNNVQ